MKNKKHFCNKEVISKPNKLLVGKKVKETTVFSTTRWTERLQDWKRRKSLKDELLANRLGTKKGKELKPSWCLFDWLQPLKDWDLAELTALQLLAEGLIRQAASNKVYEQKT